MNAKPKLADTLQALAIAKQLYPDGQIEIVDRGYDNIVALVEEGAVVRFPRNDAALVRSYYEREMLGKLKGITCVAVPRLVATHDDPPYLVTSFVPGQNVSAEFINSLSINEQQAIGKTLGTFAYELHSSVSLDDELAFRESAQLGDQFDESWAEYFARVVDQGKFALPEQTSFAKQYYAQWTAINNSIVPKVVIHDDLHIDNILFTDNKLVGILDFAEANIGTAEQEFRQLYRIDQNVLEAAVATYNRLMGVQLDVEAIKTWAIMQELGSYSRRLQAGQTDHPSFQRACNHLNDWLPAGRWDVTAA